MGVMDSITASEAVGPGSIPGRATMDSGIGEIMRFTQRYVRFQTQLRGQETDAPLGVFVAAGQVEDLPEVAEYARALLEEYLWWFNRNLTVPCLNNRGSRSVFWFRSNARDFINRVWDLVAVLQEEGVFVQKLWTNSPGMIVYSDEYQIAAIPHREEPGSRVARPASVTDGTADFESARRGSIPRWGTD